jgi:ABC-2 type transport system ATP-binding protein
VWTLIEDLAALGTTVLLTTHYLEEAEALADRVAIMHGGRIRVAGTLAEVLSSRPARISAVLPPGFPALPSFAGTATLSGPALTVETGAVQEDLGVLLAWATTHALVLDGITATQASLQEVFLDLAAHRATVQLGES